MSKSEELSAAAFYVGLLETAKDLGLECRITSYPCVEILADGRGIAKVYSLDEMRLWLSGYEMARNGKTSLNSAGV